MHKNKGRVISARKICITQLKREKTYSFKLCIRFVKEISPYIDSFISIALTALTHGRWVQLVHFGHFCIRKQKKNSKNRCTTN